MDALNSLVTQNGGLVVLLLVIACIVLGVLAGLLWRRTARLEARLLGLTRNSEGDSLEAVLDSHLDKVYELGRQVDDLATRSLHLETTLRRAVQRVALVRFNPFEDTGGNQSFALALLDGLGDGVIVSSLHARGSTRIYSKTVAKGVAEAALSEEEAEALRKAMATGSSGSKRG